MTSFTAKAPARANIIGEHTDYAPNQGHVLPTPLPFTSPLWTVVLVTGLADGAAALIVLSARGAPDPGFAYRFARPVRQ